MSRHSDDYDFGASLPSGTPDDVRGDNCLRCGALISADGMIQRSTDSPALCVECADDDYEAVNWSPTSDDGDAT